MRGGMCVIAAVLTGCGSAPPTRLPAPTAPAPLPADSAAELEALFRERVASARSRFTEADVAFMTGMIAHHAQAVQMAGMAQTRDASPSVQMLAARIRTGQLDEIGIMQQWLRERGQPAPDPDFSGAHAGHAGHAHQHGAMPGMLSPEQIARLEQARGPDFDRLFLMHMIEHHRGAVVMVDTLLAADGAAQDAVVFRLASDINVDQTAEITRMQRMLAAMLGATDSR